MLTLTNQAFSELFNLLGFTVLEIHSRKSQSQRSKASDQFRDSNKVIMFTSDVTARGMDYPDVSKVLITLRNLSTLMIMIRFLAALPLSIPRSTFMIAKSRKTDNACNCENVFL
jgi:hypothetical protein